MRVGEDALNAQVGKALVRIDPIGKKTIQDRAVRRLAQAAFQRRFGQRLRSRSGSRLAMTDLPRDRRPVEPPKGSNHRQRRAASTARMQLGAVIDRRNGRGQRLAGAFAWTFRLSQRQCGREASNAPRAWSRPRCFSTQSVP